MFYIFVDPNLKKVDTFVNSVISTMKQNQRQAFTFYVFQEAS